MLNPYTGLEAAAFAYKVFFVLCLPVCAWVAWSDLRTMKIPNKAVIALLVIYAVVGFLVIPVQGWLWQWVNFLVILALGFLLNAIANVGAGDAKFAAATAPFFFASHLPLILPLFAAFLLGAFAAHRLMRAVPAVRAMAPDWVSWSRRDFPMGLALVGTFLTYLAWLAFPSLAQALTGSTSM